MKMAARLYAFFACSLLVAFGFIVSDHVLRHRPERFDIERAVQGDIGEEHPYGRRFLDDLPWENGAKFQEARQRSGVVLRMAAFQTTLPDPLPGEEFNVGLAADLLAGTVVEPGKIFSMNRTLGPYSRGRGFREGPAYMGTYVIKTIGGGVCKIATTLYNVATLSNMEIVERRSHGMLVPYVPPGQDATVSYGAQDFKFRNSTGKPLLIWADTIGNTLYIAFYGGVQPPVMNWRHQVLNRQKTWTVSRTNPALPPGEERVLLEGAEGMTVKTWLIIHRSEGKMETKYLGIDHYKPMPRIMERGPGR